MDGLNEDGLYIFFYEVPRNHEPWYQVVALDVENTVAKCIYSTECRNYETLSNCVAAIAVGRRDEMILTISKVVWAEGKNLNRELLIPVNDQRLTEFKNIYWRRKEEKIAEEMSRV